MLASTRRSSGFRSFIGIATVAILSLGSICCSPSDGEAAPPLPSDDAGFTILRPSEDSRLIYVSASDGADENDGLTPETPVQSVERGKSLLRHGFPDHLLFRRGDVWNEGLALITTSGRSATEPLVIGAYGEESNARPRFEVPGGGGGVYFTGAGEAPESASFIALVSLDFVSIDRGPSSGDAVPDSEPGFLFLRGTSGLLVEDCVFQYFTVGIVIQHLGGPSLNNIALRRNLVLDSWRPQPVGHSEGIYVDTIVNLLIEENILDHNGWSEHHADAYPTIYNHGMYLQNSTEADGFVVRGNIVLRGASHGMQLRSGGTAEGNFFAEVPISLLLSNTPGNVNQTTAHALDNVIVEGVNTTPREGTTAPADLPRGWAIDINEEIGGGTVQRNIVANCAGSFCTGIQADRPVDYAENVTWNWGDSSSHLPPSDGPFPDPGRSVASYSASLGRAETFEAFVEELRLQRKGNWRLAYTAEAVNAYFRAGFGL